MPRFLELRFLPRERREGRLRFFAELSSSESLTSVSLSSLSLSWSSPAPVLVSVALASVAARRASSSCNLRMTAGSSTGCAAAFAVTGAGAGAGTGTGTAAARTGAGAGTATTVVVAGTDGRCWIGATGDNCVVLGCQCPALGAGTPCVTCMLLAVSIGVAASSRGGCVARACVCCNGGAIICAPGAPGATSCRGAPAKTWILTGAGAGAATVGGGLALGGARRG